MTEPSPRRTLPRWHPDPLARSAIERIRSCGLAVTAHDRLCADHAHDHDDACPYAYTSGRSLHTEPELVVYGLGAEAAVDILCDTIDEFEFHDWRQLVSDGAEFAVESIDVPLRLIEVVDTTDLHATNLLFPNTTVLQVVWPDDHGVYPWEDGYSLEPHAQHIKGVEGFARDVGPRVISRSTGPNRAQRRKRKS